MFSLHSGWRHSKDFKVDNPPQSKLEDYKNCESAKMVMVANLLRKLLPHHSSVLPVENWAVTFHIFLADDD